MSQGQSPTPHLTPPPPPPHLPPPPTSQAAGPAGPGPSGGIGIGHIEVLLKSRKTTLAPNVRPPPPRAGHNAFSLPRGAGKHSVDPRVWIMGGANGDTFLNDMYCLHTGTLKWTQIHTYFPPKPRAYASVSVVAPAPDRVAVGEAPMLVQFGGYNQGDCFSDVSVLLDWSHFRRSANQPQKLSMPVHLMPKTPPPGVKSDEWATSGVQGEVPLGLCNHAAQVYARTGRHIFIFGGWNSNFMADFYVLHTANWKWVRKTCAPDQSQVSKGRIDGLNGLPAARASCASCVVGKHGRYMLIHGGQDQFGQRADLWVLDLAEYQWIRLRPSGSAPSPRSGHTATTISHQDVVVFYGGWTGGAMSEEVHVLNVRDRNPLLWRWAPLRISGDRLKGVAGHTATLVGSHIVVFGGLSKDGVPSADVRSIQIGVGRYDFEAFDLVDLAALRGEGAAAAAGGEGGEGENGVDGGRRLFLGGQEGTQQQRLAALGLEELTLGDGVRDDGSGARPSERISRGSVGKDLSGDGDDSDEAGQKHKASKQAYNDKLKKDADARSVAAREAEAAMLRRKVIERAVASGATFAEAAAIADGTADDALMKRIQANSRRMRKGKLKALPPAPPGEPKIGPSPELTDELDGGLAARRLAAKVKKSGPKRGQDPLDWIIESSENKGPETDATQAAKAAPLSLADAELERARAELGQDTGMAERGPPGGRPQRRAYVLDSGAGDDSSEPAWWADDPELRSVIETATVRGAQAWAGARGRLAALGRGDTTGGANEGAGESVERAARLLQAAWRARRRRQLVHTIRMVIRIQAWLRGRRVRKELAEQGIVVKTTYLEAAIAMTRRERRYRIGERLRREGRVAAGMVAADRARAMAQASTQGGGFAVMQSRGSLLRPAVGTKGRDANTGARRVSALVAAKTHGAEGAAPPPPPPPPPPLRR